MTNNRLSYICPFANNGTDALSSLAIADEAQKTADQGNVAQHDTGTAVVPGGDIVHMLSNNAAVSNNDVNTTNAEQTPKSISGKSVSTSSSLSSPDLSSPYTTMSCSMTVSQSTPVSSPLAAMLPCSSLTSHSTPVSSIAKARPSSNTPSTLHGATLAAPTLAAPTLAGSPYANIRPPAHLTLPPPPVCGAGPTFPKVNTSMANLSSAVPTGALPSFKNQKLKGKFWADDLDEGHDYDLDDILPAGSKVKFKGRHTRRNPGPIFDPSLT